MKKDINNLKKNVFSSAVVHLRRSFLCLCHTVRHSFLPHDKCDIQSYYYVTRNPFMVFLHIGF